MVCIGVVLPYAVDGYGVEVVFAFALLVIDIPLMGELG